MATKTDAHAEEELYVREYVYSQSTRYMHWIRMIAIVILIVTGFFIAYPFVSPAAGQEPVKFLQAEMRFVHLVFGWVLIAVTIYRAYIFMFDKYSYKERLSFIDFFNPMKWIRQVKNYMLIGPHPHKTGMYNPLQLMAYLGVTVAVIIISVTGCILYFNVYHEGLGAIMYELFKPMEAWMGGLAMVRQIHHIATWFFVLFIPIHIYLATWNSARYPNGAMDTIFSGYHWHKKGDH